jgi:hypothetical protein
MIRAAVIASLVLASASPASAAGMFFVVVDAKGYCSVVQPKPAADSGLTIIGEADGYASKEAADAALKGSPAGTCKNIF